MNLDDGATVILEDEMTDDALVLMLVQLMNSPEGASPSKSPRNPNKKRDFAAAHAWLVANYFSGPDSVCDDKDFERRFRMSRRLFNRIHDKLMGLDPFVQKCDAARKPGIHPLVKLVACFRHIACGDGLDREDENLSIGEATPLPIVRAFCRLIVEEFGPQYLNGTPTEQERKAIHKEMEKRGFPGCLASWDCKHFVWKNCPMRLAGQHQGHHEGGKKTLAMEAICDHRKHSWQVNFGDAGALNDINVLDKSSIVGGMMSGNFSVKTEPCAINGNVRDWMYFLVDGIYPEWAIFVSTFSNPIETKKKQFAVAQERQRKDIECAFGILVQRFHVLARPLRQWHLEHLHNLVHACVIIHNVIVDDRSGTLEVADAEDDPVTIGSNFALFGRPQVSQQAATQDGVDVFAARVGAFDAAVQSTFEHLKLKQDLVEHTSNLDTSN